MACLMNELDPFYTLPTTIGIIMKRISSRSTFFSKRVFPVLWFGFAALFVIVNLTGQHGTKQFELSPFLPLAVGAIGLFAMWRFWRFMLSLADEVWDDGKALIIKKSGQELRVPLDDIINVTYGMAGNSPRATLTLRHSTQLGREIAFIPHRDFFSLNLLSTRNRILDELIERIDAQRRH